MFNRVTKTQKETSVVTYFGSSLGDGYYFLVTSGAVFALSVYDAVRAQKNGAKWVPSSLLSDIDRTKVYHSWETAHLVLGY